VPWRRFGSYRPSPRAELPAAWRPASPKSRRSQTIIFQNPWSVMPLYRSSDGPIALWLGRQSKTPRAAQAVHPGLACIHRPVTPHGA
jgi:hypothetical protein